MICNECRFSCRRSPCCGGKYCHRCLHKHSCVVRSDSTKDLASCVEEPIHSHTPEPSTTFISPPPAQRPETYDIGSEVDIHSHVELTEVDSSIGQMSQPLPYDHVVPLSVPSGLEENTEQTVQTVPSESDRVHANDMSNDDGRSIDNTPLRSPSLLPSNDHATLSNVVSPCLVRKPLSEDTHQRGRVLLLRWSRRLLP